jgi:hypothetical protein
VMMLSLNTPRASFCARREDGIGRFCPRADSARTAILPPCPASFPPPLFVSQHLLIERAANPICTTCSCPFRDWKRRSTIIAKRASLLRTRSLVQSYVSATYARGVTTKECIAYSLELGFLHQPFRCRLASQSVSRRNGGLVETRQPLPNVTTQPRKPWNVGLDVPHSYRVSDAPPSAVSRWIFFATNGRVR